VHPVSLAGVEPISFQPIYKERVWGGRQLESIYDRQLPDAHTPYGESWDLTDRGPDQSIVNGGRFHGLTLNTLWNEYREEIFGPNLPDADKFPLLIKILDSQSDLSVQVHPPESLAKKFGGEAKTEMWYIADVTPEGKLYVGVKDGVSKEEFENAIAKGTVAEKIHAIHPEKGDFLHLDSGRLHSIGAGFLIYEIQQNSDTTYRVFDWNRMGLDGKPRPLHVEQSLECIDFSDVEPSMGQADGNTISDCPHFKVDQIERQKNEAFSQQHPKNFAVITVVDGVITDSSGKDYIAGDSFLMPAQATTLTCKENALYLETTIPH